MTGARQQNIISQLPLKQVIAHTRKKQIIPITAKQRHGRSSATPIHCFKGNCPSAVEKLITCRAKIYESALIDDQPVIPVTTIQEIQIIAKCNAVIPHPGINTIRTIAAGDEIISLTTYQCVITVIAMERIRVVATIQKVMAVSSQ